MSWILITIQQLPPCKLLRHHYINSLVEKQNCCTNRPAGPVVQLSLRVREVPSSNPGQGLVLKHKMAVPEMRKWDVKCDVKLLSSMKTEFCDVKLLSSMKTEICDVKSLSLMKTVFFSDDIDNSIPPYDLHTFYIPPYQSTYNTII